MVSQPATSTGTALLVVVPLPSSPTVLKPQQYAAPPVVSPHVKPLPVLTTAKLSPPETSTGVPLPVVEPSPSWPQVLSPQQYAAPPVLTPHVWSPVPALTVPKARPPPTANGPCMQ